MRFREEIRFILNKYSYRSFLTLAKKYSNLNISRILDLGCGKGELLRCTRNDKFNIIGCDICREKILLAQKNTNKDLIICDANYLPFKKNIFDVIICLDVIEHITSIEQYIQNIKLVLKKDGIIILRTPNPLSIGAKQKKKKWFGYLDPSHVTLRTLHYWRKSFNKMGFITIIYGSSFLWDSPYYINKLILFQKLLYKILSFLINMIHPILPWEKGENSIIIFRRK